MEFDGVGSDATLAMEEIEEGDAGYIDDDVVADIDEAIGGHAEAGFDLAARVFERGSITRGAGSGTFIRRNFRDHRGAGIIDIGEKDVEVSIVFFLDADEAPADGEGLKFEWRDAGVFGEDLRRGLRSKPGDGRGSRRKINGGGVRVAERLHGPALSATVNSAAEERGWRTVARGGMILVVEIESDENQGDGKRDKAALLAA